MAATFSVKYLPIAFHAFLNFLLPVVSEVFCSFYLFWKDIICSDILGVWQTLFRDVPFWLHIAIYILSLKVCSSWPEDLKKVFVLIYQLRECTSLSHPRKMFKVAVPVHPISPSKQGTLSILLKYRDLRSFLLPNSFKINFPDFLNRFCI